jgi:hypothetical protein
MEPTSPPGPARPGRETRLLALTVVVSVLVLLALSRFRFPEGSPRVAPTPPAALALEQLAARATYDELAAIVAQLQAQLARSVVALPVEDGAAAAAQQMPARPGFVPGLRVAADRALALLPRGARLQGPAAAAAVIDTVHRLAVLPVAADAEALRWGGEAGDPALGPRYVIAVEGGRAGAAFRPVFLPRADAAHDPHWGGEVLVLGGAVQVQPGALLFTLRGRFLGLAIADHGYPAIVPTETLMRASAALLAGQAPAPVDLGIEVQPLDDALARAANVRRGLLVTAVHPNGPAAGRLQFSDVIQASDGQPLDSEEALLAAARRARPDQPLRLTVARRGDTREVALLPVRGPVPSTPGEPGLELRALASGGAEVVRVFPSSPAARAGLRPGDVVVHAGDQRTATPSQIRRAFAEAPAGGAILLAIDRGGTWIALALVKE